MANRTGTYIAFDGLGQTDPTKSDFRYYATIQAWSSGKNIEFKFVNSHAKTYAVRDSSKVETLKARIRERLGASKNCVAILTNDTRKSGSMLSYEIEKAVDFYDLPLICIYPGFETIFKPQDLSNLWPTALLDRVNDKSLKAIHLPFKKDALLDAISQFSVNNRMPNSAMAYYSKEAHKAFGCKVR